MSEPLVSVIIRTYNRRATVGRAIDSVLQQSYPSKRIIVIDDGSTDDTKSIIPQSAVLEYHLQSNRGTWGALASGLHLASGEYVAFLDSDDEWDVDFLERSISLLEKFSAGFAFSNYRLLRPNGDKLKNLFEASSLLQRLDTKSGKTAFDLSPDDVRFLFVRHIPSPSSSLVIRRPLVAGTRWIGSTASTSTSEDWNLILKMIFTHHVSAAVETRPLWTKWLLGDNVAEGKDDILLYCDRQTDNRRFMLENFGTSMTASEKEYIRNELADLNFECAYKTSAAGMLREGIKHYARAFSFRPSIKPLVASLKSVGKALLVKAGVVSRPTWKGLNVKMKSE